MVRVAVIDDGVSTDVYPFLTHLSDSIEITAAGIIKISPTNGRTHGTLCAAIIKLYAPETEIVSVKVLNSETGMGKVWKIRKALEWCLENQITVINLSAGSFSFQEKERLRKVFSKLEEKGIPLICAWPNNERFSIYTDFTWTVSVEREKTLCENQYKSRNGHFLQADFYASSIHSFPLFDESSETIVSQNSHAAPVITAMVAHNIYAEGFSSLEKIYRSLTPFQERRFHIKPVPDFINKTIVLGKIAYPEKYCTFQKNPKSLRKMLDSETPFSLSVFPPYTKSSEELAKCIPCSPATEGKVLRPHGSYVPWRIAGRSTAYRLCFNAGSRSGPSGLPLPSSTASKTDWLAPSSVDHLPAGKNRTGPKPFLYLR